MPSPTQCNGYLSASGRGVGVASQRITDWRQGHLRSIIGTLRARSRGEGSLPWLKRGTTQTKRHEWCFLEFLIAVVPSLEISKHVAASSLCFSNHTARKHRQNGYRLPSVRSVASARCARHLRFGCANSAMSFTTPRSCASSGGSTTFVPSFGPGRCIHRRRARIDVPISAIALSMARARSSISRRTTSSDITPPPMFTFPF